MLKIFKHRLTLELTDKKAGGLLDEQTNKQTETKKSKERKKQTNIHTYIHTYIPLK